MLNPENNNKKDSKNNSPEKKRIKKIETILESERSWDKIEHDLEKILTIIKGNSFLKEPKIKKIQGEVEINYKNSSPDGIFYFQTSEDLPILKDKQFTIYKQSNGYQVELDFELLSFNSNLIACKPTKLKKGENLRKYPRVTSNKDSVFGSHFLVAKIDQNIDSYLGYSADVIFQEVQKEFQEKYPLLQLKYTYQKRIKSSELLALEEDEKPIFVNDTIKMQNAEGDFIDIILHYEMEDILDEKKTQFFQEKISSFIYYPIYFRVLNYEKFIGYAYLPAILPNRLKPEIIDLMKEVELKITQVILDSHTVMVEDKQAILNYSENGLQFLIKNKTIAQGIIVKPSFSVDITFKLQPPIRLAIMAKNIYKIEDVYYIGGEIIGATNDPIGLDKYRNSINEQRN